MQPSSPPFPDAQACAGIKQVNDEHGHGVGDALLVQVAQRLLGQMRKPFKVDKLSLNIGASIGIACYPAHGGTLDVLLEVADNSLYDVKADGRMGYRLASGAAANQQPVA